MAGAPGNSCLLHNPGMTVRVAVDAGFGDFHNGVDNGLGTLEVRIRNPEGKHILRIGSPLGGVDRSAVNHAVKIVLHQQSFLRDRR